MLSAKSLKQIDIELAKYPADQRRSAIMGALRIAQTEKAGSPPKPSLLLPTTSASRRRRHMKSPLSTICTTLSLSANTN
ncbi:NADH dehydrogenase subunit E [Neisseria gonorrhoeae]|uniref:NADH dehydrogenase subunit E n=1 Tax=Neisseria gonorrhoeae TaxID=485 RepID=A0A379B1W8_NEIGO|nr:NADH dehydrogenase subunit E [Neisseria gonorrhoeae]